MLKIFFRRLKVRDLFDSSFGPDCTGGLLSESRSFSWEQDIFHRFMALQRGHGGCFDTFTGWRDNLGR